MNRSFSFIRIKLVTTSLRHVQGFPLLGLLWRFRCHVGYSEADPHSLAAFRFRQSPFRCVPTIGMSDCRMRLSSLSAYCGCDVVHSWTCSNCREAAYHIMAFVTAFRHNFFSGRETIVQSIQTSSSCLPFSLAVQSCRGNWATYRFDCIL